MKYTLTIDQRSIIENNLDLDIIDAAIIHVCKNFSTQSTARFFVEDKQVYYWFSHQLICDQLPMLRLKQDSVYRRMKGLCERHFLTAHPKNRQMNNSWYRFEQLCDVMDGTIGSKSDGSDANPKPIKPTIGSKSEPSDQNPKGIGSKSEGPSDQNPMYNTISDKGINEIVSLSTQAHTDNADDQKKQSPAPLPPAPLSLRKQYGDGELYKLVGKFWRDNPDKYDLAMYTEFLENWTAIVQSDADNPDNVGKELWKTHRVFPLAKRLEKWLPGYEADKERKGREAATKGKQQPNNRSGKNGTGNRRPTKRTPYVNPDTFNRDSAATRDANPSGDTYTDFKYVE